MNISSLSTYITLIQRVIRGGIIIIIIMTTIRRRRIRRRVRRRILRGRGRIIIISRRMTRIRIRENDHQGYSRHSAVIGMGLTEFFVIPFVVFVLIKPFILRLMIF